MTFFNLTDKNVQRCSKYIPSRSPKFKRVSLNETPEFPFWRLNFCVDFDLKDSKKLENIKKLNIIKFPDKNLYPQNCLTPFSNPGSKTGFHNNTLV